MNMILADIQPTQWILLAVIALLIICYPIFIIFKNKKEQEKANQLTNSIKVGKEVLTSSGVYGTIVDIQENENSKIVTLETGTGNYKSYIAVDVLAIYTVLNPDPVEEKVEVKEEKSEEKTEEVKQEEVEETKEVVVDETQETKVENNENIKQEQKVVSKTKKDKKSKK